MPAAPSPAEQLAAMLSANNSAALPPVPDPSEGNPLAQWFSNGGVAGMLGMTPAYQQIAENQASADAAPDLKSKLAILLQNPMAGALGVDAPIRAYHGSPHSFDKFDLSKIGTGEGAQAYGHGLYFAGNEDVARSYKFAGQPAYAGQTQYRIATDALEQAKARGLSGADARIAALDILNEKALNEYMPINRQPIYDAMNNFDAFAGKTPGHMYEVNLHADPASLLDWDKPLAAQTPQVQQSLGYGGLVGSPDPEAVRAAFQKAREMGVPTRTLPEYQALQEQNRAANQFTYDKLGIDNPGIIPGELQASALHTGLTRKFGEPAAASQYLQDRGIPGIQYLDAGSRNVPTTSYLIKSKAGDWSSQLYDDLSQAQAHLPGYQANHFPDAAIEPVQNNISRNYVMFDPARIEIMRKYGLLAGMLGGSAAAAGGDQQ